MSDSETWSAPKSDAMLAAYRISDGMLEPCGKEQDADHTERASQTLELWQATQALPDAALLVVKSEKATSLGLRNGGLIIEGHSKLNIGLMRASTRALSPVEQRLDVAPIPTSDDTFRRVFWAVVARLQGAVMERTYHFFLGGVEGQVHVAEGKIRFTGDFLTPSDFVGELQAACEVGEEVRYTILADQPRPDVPSFGVSELIAHVTERSEDGGIKFEADGWPVSCGEGECVDIVQSLSVIAAASGRMPQHDSPISISILSDQNLPLVTGQAHSDGTIDFRLS